MTETRTRAGLDFDLDDDSNLDLADFAPSKAAPKPDRAALDAVAQGSGFKSREATKAEAEPAKRPSRRRRVSPYSDQMGNRCRPEVKLIFQELSERLGQYDYTTFEQALRALLVSGGHDDLLKRFDRVTGENLPEKP